jgi:hypothetical protein
MKPQIYVRDVLWLIVVVAISVGWWLDHQQAAREKQETARDNLILRVSGDFEDARYLSKSDSEFRGVAFWNPTDFFKDTPGHWKSVCGSEWNVLHHDGGVIMYRKELKISIAPNAPFN